MAFKLLDKETPFESKKHAMQEFKSFNDGGKSTPMAHQLQL